MEFVEVRVEGATAVVRLKRPPINAISFEVATQLGRAFGECESASIRAVVLTGEKHFGAGGDIKGFGEAFELDSDEKTGPALAVAARMLESLPKPTFAAINGFALGGGLELALAADFRWVGTSSKLGQPEIQLGLIPGAGGTQRLPRVVGYQMAKHLILSGRQIGAEEALRIGLADHVLPDDEVLDATISTAQNWALGATQAIGAAKKAIEASWALPVEEGISVEHKAFQHVFRTRDAREGVSAFIEKRRPEFTGD